METFLAFGAALGLIALLELGDKTQLVTISLAARRPWAPVLAGAATGLTAATAIGAAIGGLMAAALSGWLPLIKLAGGALFVALGVWIVVQAVRLRGRPETSELVPRGHRGAFAEAAGYLFIAEFGDKTQVAVIILAATYAAPISVFVGASAAETLIAVTSVIIGTSLSRILTKRWLGLVSTSLFLIAGALLILEAFLSF